MLKSGSKLGPYEIVGPLGAGGMGEVYRARDTRLDRTVALKVLPAELSSNADLRARLDREARAISSLQHPHICVLHDIGHQDGIDYLVMECLDGETLADRLQRGPLPLEQALKTAIEIADALEKAHRSGIIHRDLKPGNIMLTKGGAKLMDFGLAKPKASMAIASAAAGPLTPSSPTTPLASLTRPASPLTQQGTVVGTFQYMAPEVLQGAEADARSDIFSFGCVLYETITGRRAFDGKSQISVFAAILEREPEPISTVQPRASSAVDYCVRTCLSKDPDERFQTAHDLKVQLRWIADGNAASVAPAAAKRSRLWRLLLPWVLGAIAALAIIVFVALRTGGTHPRARLAAQLLPPSGKNFLLSGDVAAPPVISPDGANVVLGAGGQLWLYQTVSGTYRVLEGTDGAAFPFWSPDGRAIGFFAGGKLRTEDIHGGAPKVVCDSPNARGGSWGRSGYIVFAPSIRTPLYKVAATGGTPVQVTKIDESRHTTHRWPYFLPDGNHFLYFATNHTRERADTSMVLAGSLDGKESRPVLPSAGNAIYESGYLLFVRESDLMAQRFDPGTLRLSGDPQRVAEKAYFDYGVWRNIVSASDTGVLVYANGLPQTEMPARWYNDKGEIQGTIGESGTSDPHLSLDGRKLAVVQGQRSPDIWIYDVSDPVRVRFTAEGVDVAPVWSPDGSKLVFSRVAGGRGQTNMMIAPLNGASSAQPVSPSESFQSPTDWSRDGKFILFDNGDPGATDIFAVATTPGSKPFPVVQTPAWEHDGRFSPDGKWVAYTSRESGRDEVYIVPFPGPGPKSQISTGGGNGPRWRRDGRELYYAYDNSIVAVSIDTKGQDLRLGKERKLFNVSIADGRFFAPSFDVSADGKKFVIKSTGEQFLGQAPLNLVVNWEAELKK